MFKTQNGEMIKQYLTYNYCGLNSDIKANLSSI